MEYFFSMIIIAHDFYFLIGVKLANYFSPIINKSLFPERNLLNTLLCCFQFNVADVHFLRTLVHEYQQNPGTIHA